MFHGILVFFRSFRGVGAGGQGSGVRILQGHLTLYVWYDYVILYLFGIYNYYNPLTLYMLYIICII